MPVLTEETICRAAFVKDRQVVAARMLVSFADPIGNAVRWQRVPVPVQQATGRCSSEVNQSAVARHTQSAKAALLFANDTLITTQGALDAIGMARGFSWQIKLRPRIRMNRLHPLTGVGESRTEAIYTDADCH